MSLLAVVLVTIGQVDAGSLVADGGVDSADAGSGSSPLSEIYAACPAIGPDTPLAFPVHRTGSFIEELPPDAGATSDFYVPYPRPQRSSCRLAACEARVVELDSFTRSIQLPWWAALSIAVTAASLAVYGTWEVCSRVPTLCGGR